MSAPRTGPLGVLSARGSMLYRDQFGNVTEVASTGRQIGDSLMLDATLEPTWGEGSDTITVKNSSGADMSKGDIVRISGFDRTEHPKPNIDHHDQTVTHGSRWATG